MKTRRQTSACYALIFCVIFLLSAVTAQAAKDQPEPKTLITNVRIFDGHSETLAQGMSVLVEGNKIAKIAKSIVAPEGATVIDGGDRVMTPGFIAMHERIVGTMLAF